MSMYHLVSNYAAQNRKGINVIYMYTYRFLTADKFVSGLLAFIGAN